MCCIKFYIIVLCNTVQFCLYFCFYSSLICLWCARTEEFISCLHSFFRYLLLCTYTPEALWLLTIGGKGFDSLFYFCIISDVFSLCQPVLVHAVNSLHCLVWIHKFPRIEIVDHFTPTNQIFQIFIFLPLIDGWQVLKDSACFKSIVLLRKFILV